MTDGVRNIDRMKIGGQREIYPNIILSITKPKWIAPELKQDPLHVETDEYNHLS
jgi:hypothetical protein